MDLLGEATYAIIALQLHRSKKNGMSVTGWDKILDHPGTALWLYPKYPNWDNGIMSSNEMI
jgi:hypothetical protein